MWSVRNIVGELRTRVQRAFTETKYPEHFTMMDFARTGEIQNTVSASDRDRRGYSTVDLTINDEEKPEYATFSGVLSTRLPPQAGAQAHSGYAYFRTRLQAPMVGPMGFGKGEYWPLDYYEQLAVRVRGDHRRYHVNLQLVDTARSTDVWQHRLFLQTPGEWETVLIPLRNFTLISNYEIRLVEGMGAKRIRTVGIGLVDRQDGPYRLDVAWVKAVVMGPLMNTIVEGRNSGELAGPRSASSGEGPAAPSHAAARFQEIVERSEKP